MLHGLDTGFLVAAEVMEHADHAAARQVLARLVSAGDQVAIAPQVLAEFIHVVTDPRRFTQPLSMDEARHVTQQWWTANEVVRVFPNEAATQQFLVWLGQFSLGRKRLLDTLLAATYHQAGIQSILTTNPADFATFGTFACITPSTSASLPERP
ncbi:type II toxin-antitoxin system VapC family toxin [Candidatus Entotheonella palauensis]|uniref:type II toxin-antitoxin system VapC family toxin n=1 Tax=Candidatus Entotheonella palauensis TaxID=93172 RepID=UPI000B7FC4FB|nr:PIN domain-containing protein [Candidatus Entotheonella palauensis]